MLRLTSQTRAVVEVAAVAEHIASLTAATAAFQLAPDVPEASANLSAAVSLDEAPLDPPARECMNEIRAWAASCLKIDHVPAIWRALAHQPRLLEATWRKDRLILDPGALDGVVKACAALAVALFRQSPYWISYLTQLLRVRAGLDDAGIAEVAGAVMHYVSFNTIAHGMRLDSPMSDVVPDDVAEGGRYDAFVPPGAKRKP